MNVKNINISSIFLCLCPLNPSLKPNFNISKVAHWMDLQLRAEFSWMKIVPRHAMPVVWRWAFKSINYIQGNTRKESKSLCPTIIISNLMVIFIRCFCTARVHFHTNWPLRCRLWNNHAVWHRTKNRFQIIFTGTGLSYLILSCYITIREAETCAGEEAILLSFSTMVLYIIIIIIICFCFFQSLTFKVRVCK